MSLKLRNISFLNNFFQKKEKSDAEPFFFFEQNKKNIFFENIKKLIFYGMSFLLNKQISFSDNMVCVSS